jgi:hypothetical protein
MATVRSANGEHAPLLCVDGKTEILCKTTNGGNRLRKTKTARGIFRFLEGRDTGGIVGVNDCAEKVIEAPEKEVQFLSLNQDNGLWEFSKVTRAQRSQQKVFLVKTASGKQIRCTEQHPLLTVDGFKQVGTIKAGDVVLSVGRSPTNKKNVKKNRPNTYVEHKNYDTCDQWDQVVLGSLLGDGGVYKKPTNNPYFKEQHCVKQGGYLAWKRKILEQKLRTRDIKCKSGYTGEDQVGFCTGNSPLLMEYVEFKETLRGVERLGPLGLSVWYMDDGNAGRSFGLSTECFSKEQNEKLASVLLTNFGIEVKVEKTKEYYRLRGSVEAKRRLSDVCKDHIHPDMAYKFDTSGNRSVCTVCGNDFWFYEINTTRKDVCGSVICSMVKEGSLHAEVISDISEDGFDWVYDFSLEKNHNYIGNGIINHNCADEVDIIQDLAAYEEAKNIPEPRNGKQPITFLISTRKYAFGMVQREIDEAHKTGLQIRHWNAIDMAQACTPDRHMPELPKLPVYRCEDTLTAIDEETWLNLSGPEQAKYVKEETFQGCLKNCKIYAACKGRLATHQTCKSTMLKPISHLTSQLRVNSLELRKAQILCLKPASTGLIYGSLIREKHLIYPAKVYEFITGEECNNKKMTKAELLALALQKDCPFYAGMDFGYSHNFAVVCGFVFGSRMFVTHSIAMPELEPHQQVDICRPLQRFSPTFFPDMENPQMIKVFSKAGFRMRNWQKGKGSVLGGIDIMRMKVNPGGDREPELFFVRDEDDPSLEYLFDMLQRYHWKIGADGQPSDVPDDADDDSCDACRYLIMNVFSAKGKISVSSNTYDQSHMSVQYNPTGWMRQVISDHVQDSQEYSYYRQSNEQSEKEDAPVGKKGSILWDMS